MRFILRVKFLFSKVWLIDKKKPVKIVKILIKNCGIMLQNLQKIHNLPKKIISF